MLKLKNVSMSLVPALLVSTGCVASPTSEDTASSAESASESVETRELRVPFEPSSIYRWQPWNLKSKSDDAGASPAPNAGEDAGRSSTTPSKDAGAGEDARTSTHEDAGTTTTPAPGLHASAGKVVDQNGNVVHIHGVNRSGSEFACVGGYGFFDGPTDAASITAMKAWNINAVRVPLNEDCWLGINGVAAAYSGANYRSAIETYVDLLLANGMYPIVDLHWSAPGTTLATGQQAMADSDHAPAFWTSVATAFKGSDNVVLELFNEPWPDDNQDTTAGWKCWRDGGTCSGISYPVAGMQTLVTTVRNTGATNLVLLGGLEYSNALSQWVTYKPTDPLNNLAAAWHVYQGNTCSATSCFNQIEESLLGSFPIVATEIGDSSCDGTFPPLVAAWLDARDQGYTAWTWNNWGSACSNYSLVSDDNGTPNGAYGLAYQTYLKGL